ncbi:YncE family protein [Telmatobacter bradus]|uniref:YncE family protein n=1 Tax=Telmatobacter bradus TaxID=474953 RepID=UPI003B42C61C
MKYALAALCLFCSAACTAIAQPAWSVKQTFHIGGEGGWDYVTVDDANHRLFVTRTTHTQVVDTGTGKLIADIQGQKSSHGVAIVPKLNRGFITDGGGSGAILVFDLTTYAVLDRLTAIPDVDGIIYDPSTDLVLAVSGDGNALFAFKPEIDPKTGSIGAPIKLPGAPEFLAVDGSGKAYINLADKSLVAVVSLQSRKVVAQWPVTPGGRPVGMSMDVIHHRLFIGCRNPQKLVVMNADTGTIEAALPIGAGVDATTYIDGQAFASCRDGSLTIVGENASKFEVLQILKTAEGARTMGGSGKRIFLPTAEFEPSTTGRPKAKPGTFMIIEAEAE